MDNICCVAGDDLAAKTSKNVHIKICDPKFPDSEWTYRGKRIKPQYRRWDGALFGVLAMNKEVNDRLDVAAAAAEGVPEDLFSDPDYILPLPERDIDMWVVDEAAALHERYQKEVGPAYRETAWVARSALVKMLLIGQNPNCSNYGLQLPDLSNFVRWYLGITSLEALDRVVKPPRDLKAKLKAQIYARFAIKTIKSLRLEPAPKPCFVECYFINFLSSDADNLIGGIIDSMTEAQILHDDSSSYVVGCSGRFVKQRKRRNEPKPVGVLVRIYPANLQWLEDVQSVKIEREIA